MIKINIELLKKAYLDYGSNKSTYIKMYEYYKNNSDKVNSYSAQEYQESHTMNLNYTKKFIKEEMLYSVGTPISFNSKINNSNNMIEDISYYTYHWNRNHDSELMKNLLIYGSVYELYYIDELKGQFNGRIVSPKDGYVYTDDYGNIKFFMRFYKLKFDDTQYIDVFDDKFIYHFNDSFEEVKPRQSHIFGEVPVSYTHISEEKEKDTLYSDLRDVQDGLSIISSDGVNEITNTREAILKGKGFEMTEEQIAYLKKYRFADLPDDGELEWLIKNLNPAYQQLMMEKLEETLYKLSFHINSQEEISSNVSSLALRVRMINLEMKTKLNNKALENIIIKRLYFLFYYLKVVKDIDYNYRNVTVKFNSVIPSDDLMVSQIISQMGEKLSLKTALKNFSWVENVDAEIKEIKSEQSELVQGKSLLNNTNGDNNGQ